MAYRRFGRTADHRKALLRNLATSLILQGSITTTEHKAKDLRSVVDQLITLGKKGDLASRRLANQWLFNSKDSKTGKTALQILFDEVAPRYADRNGGYTRVIKTVSRRGDGAEMARIELV
ncbi:MAG TPA: 50S ribosomal protein L17 [Erysipelothrix sp.]|nr:50S ribosomal protein L17 [Erysipelothrix sp.]